MHDVFAVQDLEGTCHAEGRLVQPLREIGAVKHGVKRPSGYELECNPRPDLFQPAVDDLGEELRFFSHLVEQIDLMFQPGRCLWISFLAHVWHFDAGTFVVIPPQIQDALATAADASLQLPGSKLFRVGVSERAAPSFTLNSLSLSHRRAGILGERIGLLTAGSEAAVSVI